MTQNSYVTAAELAEVLHYSESQAYRVIHGLNEELKKMGYVTFKGRIPRKYLEERCHIAEEEEVSS